jgi:hypothetical protein
MEMCALQSPTAVAAASQMRMKPNVVLPRQILRGNDAAAFLPQVP